MTTKLVSEGPIEHNKFYLVYDAQNGWVVASAFVLGIGKILWYMAVPSECDYRLYYVTHFQELPENPGT